MLWRVTTTTCRYFLGVGLVGLCALLAGCVHAKVSDESEIAPAPAGQPAKIYVSDFDIDVADIKSESLIPWNGPVRRFVIGSWNRSPQVFRDKAVNSMAETIVKKLRKAGYQAERWYPNEELPGNGWLVRGVVVTVDQGNRVRRAVVGFGLGEAELKVAVDVSDLASGAPKPFYHLDTDADSGKMPGAGPLIVLSPFAIPIRFVMAGQDMNECIDKTAVLIGNHVVDRINKQNSPTASQ
jgi:hypothetical protein